MFVALNKRIKQRPVRFCSRSCYSSWFSNGESRRMEGTRMCACIVCGVKTKRTKKEILSGGGKFCSKKCSGKWSSENRSGENSPLWVSGMDRTSKQIRTSARYQLWRRMVLIRDGFRCVKCGSVVSNYLIAHHKYEFCKLLSDAELFFPELTSYDAALSYAPMWDLDNGETVCPDCHRGLHYASAN